MYREFFESSSKGMMLINADNEIVDVNPSFTRITGYEAAEVFRLTPRALFCGRHNDSFYRTLWEHLAVSGSWEGEIWKKRKNGEVFPTWQTVDALRDADGNVTHYLSVFSDIMPLKTSEREAWRHSHHDGLTGLLNRRALEGRLDAEISASRRSGRNAVLIFLDLDNFSAVNARCGHKFGDRLLVAFARRLEQYLRKEDVFARLSGDEFVVLLTGLPAALTQAVQAAAGVIRNIRGLLQQPFVVDGREQTVSVSFGVSCFSVFADSAEEAIKQADTAMYQSKLHGNPYTFFHPRMTAAGALRLGFETELRHAVAAGQLALVYQPQYDQHRRLLGYEALVRWRHPQKGVLSPADFIGVAEETGVIVEMGEKILDMACRQVVAWQCQGVEVPMVAVNVSPSQFRHRDFVDNVLEIFRATGVDPARIMLEVTENLIIGNIDDVIDKMYALKAVGVRFAIDDFGTGYSSLAYLQKLPIDQLKIDRSFVKDILGGGNAAVIVNTILAMARQMGMDIIAEGVESQAHWQYLLNAGCGGMQGYWLSPPLSAERITG